MKISLDWINDYLDITIPLPELVARLTMAGLVVDSFEERNGDVILDIGTYANRPDTLGHRGMAREMAVVLGLPFKEPSWPLTESEERTADLADVQIWDEDLCPRYCGLLVQGVKVGPSPDWLRRRIEAMGLKPINNIVDATNYVLFATAQPIHAFDFAKVTAGKVIIRKAKKGERLRSLDGQDLELAADMLVIADESRPIALAGVIGGEESGITESTKDVFIECATFDPVSIRKTSKALGLQTDASYRFERGADISFAPDGARLTAGLLCKFGGKATRELIDVYPKPRKKKEVMLRLQRVNGLLGTDIGADFVERILASLGFELANQADGQSWRVKPPFGRVDIEREADLVEEIARFYGYDRIPSTLPPLKVVERYGENGDKTEKMRQVLLHQGFDEVLNQSFADPDKEALLATKRRPIELRNPVSSKAALLRTTILGGLLENIAYNLNRGLEGVHLFEWGNVYYWDEEEQVEQMTCGLATTGRLGSVYWKARKEETDFFHLKGACEALLAALRYEPFAFQPKDHPFFEKGTALALSFKGAKVGCLGRVRAKILESYSLKKPVYAGELNLTALFAKQPKPFQYSAVPRFPSVSRDLALVFKSDVSFQAIKEEMERLNLPFLESFELVDRFAGGSLPKGSVSLSFRFVFRNPASTLVAAEVDKLQAQILSQLKAAFNAKLRQEA